MNVHVCMVSVSTVCWSRGVRLKTYIIRDFCIFVLHTGWGIHFLPKLKYLIGPFFLWRYSREIFFRQRGVMLYTVGKLSLRWFRNRVWKSRLKPQQSPSKDLSREYAESVRLSSSHWGYVLRLRVLKIRW